MRAVQETIDELKAEMSDNVYNKLCLAMKDAHTEMADKELRLYQVKYTVNSVSTDHSIDANTGEDSTEMHNVCARHTKIMYAERDHGYGNLENFILRRATPMIPRA